MGQSVTMVLLVLDGRVNSKSAHLQGMSWHPTSTTRMAANSRVYWWWSESRIDAISDGSKGVTKYLDEDVGRRGV
jgi:hypothetical protein